MNKKLRTIGIIIYTLICAAIFIFPIILLRFDSIQVSVEKSKIQFVILYFIGLTLMILSVLILYKTNATINNEENIKKQYIKKEKDFQFQFNLFIHNKELYLELSKIKHDINNILQSAKTLSQNGNTISNKKNDKIINELQSKLDILNRIIEEESADV